MKKSWERELPKCAIALLALGVMCIIVFPVIWMLNISFFKQTDLFANVPKIAFVDGYTLEGYKEVLEDQRVYQWIGNSVLVTFSSIILSVLFSVFAAYALSRFSSKINNILTVVIVCTQMVAPALIVAPLYMIFAQFHLTNSHIGLILINSALVLSFSVWMLKSFFDNIPRDLDDAAQIDGCNRLGTLFRVILPICKPALTTVTVINFFDIFNEYMFAMTFIQKQEMWLSTVGLSITMTRVGLDWSTLLPQAVLTCIIPITFYFIFQRHIVSGLSSGAVKF